MHRFGYDTRGFRKDAVFAFLIGVAAAAVVAGKCFYTCFRPSLNLGPNNGLLTTLIVIAVGGLWYRWRNVV